MKKQIQLFRHRPEEGMIGDCHRTAIAMLLDMNAKDVPNFSAVGFSLDNPNGNHKEFSEAVEKWLNENGYTQFSVAFSEKLEVVFTYMKAINPGVYYMLGGQSGNGVNHTVVCLDDEIVADPSIDESGIVGPCEPDGLYWITVLMPINQKVKHG